MANTLYWNGSSWTTSETTCGSKSSSNLGNNLYLTIKLKVQFNGSTTSPKINVKPVITASGNYTSPDWWGTLYLENSSGTSLKSWEHDSAGYKEVSSFVGVSLKWHSYSGSGIYPWAYYNGTDYARGSVWETSQSIGTLTTPLYQVIYDLNGGTGSISNTKHVKLYSATVTSTTPTRTGYTFTGWKDSSGNSYASGATIAARSSDITLTAQWSQITYNVSISAGEGTTITFNNKTYTNTTKTVSIGYGTNCPYTIKANSGYTLTSRNPQTDGTQKITGTFSLSATAQRVGCHIDNGTEWGQYLVYIDNGTEWELCQIYYDDGEQWVLAY